MPAKPENTRPRTDAHRVADARHLHRIRWESVRRLLHQQLWCWGQDVKDPEDNPLFEDGFIRHGRPRGQKGTSRYHLVESNGDEIALWGFGAWFRRNGQPTGTILMRHRAGPYLCDLAQLEDVWFPNQLPDLVEPVTTSESLVTLANLDGLFEWIAAYEERVHSARGRDYREHCHRSFDEERRHCEPAALPRAWRSALA